MPHPSRAARRAQACLDIVDAQPARHMQRRATPGTAKGPFPRAARSAEDGLVARQFGRHARRPSPLQVCGACHPQPPHLSHRTGGQRRVGQDADTQGNVDPLLDQVDVAVVQHQLDLDVAMGVEKPRNQRRNVTAAELYRRGDPEQPAHRGVAGAGRRGLVVGHKRPRLVVKHPACLGRRQPTRRPIDQADADAGFESVQGARHRGRRASQPRGGAHQAALLHDAHKNGKLVEAIQTMGMSRSLLKIA